MRNRRTLRTRTPLLAVAGAALAALALTACDNGTGTKDEGAARHTPAASASGTSAANQPSADANAQQGSTGSTAHGTQTSAGAPRAPGGSGDGGQTGHKLTVYFQGMTPNSDGGATANVTLPAKGVYYDSSLKVTYWQQDASDIAGW